MSSDQIIDPLEELFIGRGTQLYLGEPVTVTEHMLQCAALAQAQGAPEAQIAAALLHDVGHLLIDEAGHSSGADEKHEERGAAFLEDFPIVVVTSVRLHVAAKRYLCAIDKTYFDKLSDASRHSLSLQGGPMSLPETAIFEGLAFHREAIRIRIWDDWGKTPGLGTPSFRDFRPLLQRVLLQKKLG